MVLDGCLYCPLMCVTHSCHDCCHEPDILLIGDSGVDYWTTGGCCCMYPCNGGSPAWHDLQDSLKEKGQSAVCMGCTGAPAYEICCCLPFALLKNGPRNLIATQSGGNDLIWLPFCCV